MTTPTIHATTDDLGSELWWAQHIDPVARAHGIDPTKSHFGLDIDTADPSRQYLKHPRGQVLLIVHVHPAGAGRLA